MNRSGSVSPGKPYQTDTETKMKLATNVSMLSAQNLTVSPTGLSEETCFMFDVNFHTTRHLYVVHIITSIINASFSLTAIAGNAVVIFTVWATPSLHSPSNILICCLAGSDLMVGLLTQPCFVLHKIGEIFHRLEMYCITRMLLESTGNITAGASVFIMAATSIERWLALRLHLRYNELVTVGRVLTTVSFLWIFLIVLAVFRVFLIRPKIYNTILITLVSLCLFSTYLAYVKILQCVRHHERRIQGIITGIGLAQTEEKAGTLKSLIRFKRSTISMFLIVGVFSACFLPLLSVSLAHQIWGYTVGVKAAYAFVSSLAFINSSINPLLYCWRMKSLRNAMKATFKRRSFKAWR
ncbi:Adenosine receptor A2b [Acropora cervicornis]|uniref:Adenosine receptor A2b n=1 Tax=Acropora cervicornis TaxID=6130 RepID=A0AAD9R558_ACRCE|nr:Adenosine receptor A2b [Acropora cervicornis]